MTHKYRPVNTDLGLLIIRLTACSSLFVRHGIEKLFHFDDMLEIFPDPLFIGKLPSLIFALFTDGILSLFVLLGLFTRKSVVLIALNLTIAFFVFHNANLDGGEIAFVYLGVMILLFLCGPGKYSLDYMLYRKQQAKSKEGTENQQ
ncbi:DoxX family protein [Muricauda oceani]|uniref:DoxX family protein n=1 Tax=Flagellimonas oceani TaxID=2698672 RepID=A0A6G7IY68_9FLAO|nr:DoxX family protein [Allomuricauda oceani]MBW8244891.1 DoxX family protein [Allomuricauda oceani]QII43553.1 DoxX family protein [Allomuricauda oceani]